MKYKKETTFIFICLHYGESFREVEERNSFYFRQFRSGEHITACKEYVGILLAFSFECDEFLKKYMIETSSICISFQHCEF